MLHSVGSISTHISTDQWDNINNRINNFLDDAATHPDSKLTYHKSDMHLWIHTDASYLVETKARLCAGGYCYFRNKHKLTIQSDDPPTKHNHPVLIRKKFIDDVMSSMQ